MRAWQAAFGKHEGDKPTASQGTALCCGCATQAGCAVWGRGLRAFPSQHHGSLQVVGTSQRLVMAEQWFGTEPEVTCPCPGPRQPVPGCTSALVQQSLLLLGVLETIVLPSSAKGHVQLTFPSPDPEDGCLFTQGLDSFPQAFGVHLFPCQNAQELPVVLGFIILT